MPNIDRHSPGSFCWLELATTDQDAAKRFYGEMFGWSAADFPMGPSGAYTIFSLEDRSTAAAYTINPQMRSQGVPPFWGLYVATDSADQSAAKTTDAGGKVIAPPFEVGEFGRMAVLHDATGAVISVWQGKQNPGTGIEGVPGTLCWADLSTPDPDKAVGFYKTVFGWEISPGHDNTGYLHIKNGERYIGGIPPAKFHNPQAPPHWLSYIQVGDCDASAAKVRTLGGRLYMEPSNVEKVGRMAIAADPQGAVFAVFQPFGMQ
jgi:predicted enzyme related to lactoylglutathione lyase